MSLQFHHLDAPTRAHMIAELHSDNLARLLYISPRLNENGAQNWAALLEEAFAHQHDAWLATEIRNRAYLKTHEERRKPTGGTSVVQVAITAHETLAEGEFNRFYVRGLCLRAMQENIPAVVVYRARHSENPRSTSEALIGKRFAPEDLLKDLRSSPGVDTALGVPPGPNSGLCIRLP